MTAIPTTHTRGQQAERVLKDDPVEAKSHFAAYLLGVLVGMYLIVFISAGAVAVALIGLIVVAATYAIERNLRRHQ